MERYRWKKAALISGFLGVMGPGALMVALSAGAAGQASAAEKRLECIEGQLAEVLARLHQGADPGGLGNGNIKKPRRLRREREASDTVWIDNPDALVQRVAQLERRVAGLSGEGSRSNPAELGGSASEWLALTRLSAPVGGLAKDEVQPVLDSEADRSVVAAEQKVAALEERIADLELLERQILSRVDQHLVDARNQRDQIIQDVLAETGHLNEVRESQAGKLDVAAVVSGAQDTILGSDLSDVVRGIEHFLVNIDQMMGDGVSDPLESWSDRMRDFHAGRGLMDTGAELEGVTIADLLAGMSQQYQGMPMPAEAAQVAQMLTQYGALGYVRMWKTSFKHMDLGEVFAQIAGDTRGMNPSAILYELALHCPGRILPAAVAGLASALEGLDLCVVFEVLASELKGVTPVPLLAGVEAGLQGGDVSKMLSVAASQMPEIDLGRILYRIGESFETVSLGTALDTMATDLDGVTIADAIEEAEQGLEQMGLGPVELPVVLKRSGESLRRLELPRRIEGLAGMLEQMSGYLQQTRVELGLVQVDAERHALERLEATGEGTTPELALKEEEWTGTAVPMSDDSSFSEIPQNQDSVDSIRESLVPLSDDGSADPAEQEAESEVGSEALEESRKEIEWLEKALQDLKSQGFKDDHPAILKARKKLAEAKVVIRADPE